MRTLRLIESYPGSDLWQIITRLAASSCLRFFLTGRPIWSISVRLQPRPETLGYDSLWLQERIIGDFTMLEPVTLLSYVAAITTKLRLGTSVILLPLRNPLQLAKAYSTLDVMSGGRAVMGVGLGGGHLGSHEDVFGYTREGRVTRFTEAVQIMKLLWTEPKTSFQGRYWNFRDVSMEPKPIQKPHLPLWFGGHHENALKRAVKYR